MLLQMQQAHGVVAEVVQAPRANEDAVQTASGQGVPSTQQEWKTIMYYAGPNKTLGRTGQLHSQGGQDWLVSTLLSCKDKGFFVDLAANDAVHVSNTLMLERDFAWNGICIEPNTQYLYSLSNRKCRVAAAAVGSPRDSNVKFALRNELGGIVGNEFDNKDASKARSVELHTVPLGDLLKAMDAPKQMDYLSLDVEGAESIVMQNFPWDTYTFAVITVERPKADLVKKFQENGYKFVSSAYNTWDDQVWVSKDLADSDKIKEVEAWSPGNSALPASCMTERQYKVKVAEGRLQPAEPDSTW